MHPVAALPNNIFVFTLEIHTVLSLHYGDDGDDEDYDSENDDGDDVKQDVKALCGYSDTHSFIIMKNPSRVSFRHPHVAIMRGLGREKMYLHSFVLYFFCFSSHCIHLYCAAASNIRAHSVAK